MPNHTTPLEQRFWKFVTPGPFDQCWPWQGAITKGGYGKIGAGGKYGATLNAHRVAYELHYGPIPDGMFILHKCDRRSCCNPAHLFLGTAADNTADMVAKCRDNFTTSPRGERQARAKLAESDVREIRKLRAEGMTLDAIAQRYKVQIPAIFAIVHRRTWKHVVP